MGNDAAGVAQEGDFIRSKVQAVSEDAAGTGKAAVRIDCGVGRLFGEKFADSGDFVVIFREVGLDISAGFVGEAGGITEEFPAAGNRETGADGVFETSIRGTVPALDEAAGFGEGDGGDFFGFETSVAPAIHHDLAKDGAEARLFGCEKAFVAAVFVDCRVEDGEGGAIAGKFGEEGRGNPPGGGGIELAFEGEDVAFEPREEGGFATGHSGVLGEVGVQINEARDEGASRSEEPGEAAGFGEVLEAGIFTGIEDASVFEEDRAVANAAKGFSIG